MKIKNPKKVESMTTFVGTIDKSYKCNKIFVVIFSKISSKELITCKIFKIVFVKFVNAWDTLLHNVLLNNHPYIDILILEFLLYIMSVSDKSTSVKLVVYL